MSGPDPAPCLSRRIASRLVSAPKLVLAVTLGLTLLAALDMLTLKIDPATERIFPQHHPALKNFKEFREVFGNDEFIVVAWTAPEPVLTRPELVRMQTLTRAFEAITLTVGEGAEARTIKPVRTVRSLTNAITLAPGILQPDLAPLFPDDIGHMTELKLNQARRAIRTVPYVKPVLLSEDERSVSLVIEIKRPPKGGQESSEQVTMDLVVEVRKVVARELGAKGIEAHLAGSPIVKVEIVEALARDLAIFVVPLLLVAAIVAWMIFRSPVGVLIPLTVIFVTSALLLGFMALMGIAIRPMTSLLPPLMFVVGIADSIHVLVELQVLRRSRPELPATEVAIEGFMRILPPCTLTSLTTSIGFGSLVFSDIEPVREFGMFAALGTVLAFLVTFAIVPAMWLLAPIEAGKATRAPRAEGLANLSLSKALPFSVLLLVIGVLCATQLRNISFNTDYVGFFKEDSAIRRAGDFIEERFVGIGALELVVKGSPNQMRDPKVLRAMLELERELRALPDVDTALSIADLIAFGNKRMTGHERIPEAEQLARMEAVFRSAGARNPAAADAGDEIHRFVSVDASTARIACRIRAMGSERLLELLVTVRALTKKHTAALEPAVVVEPTGTPVIFSETAEFMLDGQLRSFVQALIAITIVMILALKSLRLGLLSVLPNLFPIAVTFGCMALLEIPLNSFNSMVASVAIGIAVDDTIHILVGFQRFRRMSPLREALHETLTHTGAAVIVTSIMLACGFAILCLGSFRPTAHFGFLTCVSIISALVGDLFLLPGLVLFDERMFGSCLGFAGAFGAAEDPEGLAGGLATGATAETVAAAVEAQTVEDVESRSEPDSA